MPKTSKANPFRRSLSRPVSTINGRRFRRTKSSKVKPSPCSRCPAPTRRPARARTCRATTSSHPTFKRNGVDDIVCISVNDAFVMSEWQRDQEAPTSRFIPDGNGEFTQRMGMLVDKSDLGFGKRSWRYSMLVQGRRDREDVHRAARRKATRSRSPTPTRCSTTSPQAEGAGARRRSSPSAGCPHCARAKALLDKRRPRVRGSLARQGHHLQHAARRFRRRHDAAGLHRRQAHRRRGRPGEATSPSDRKPRKHDGRRDA